MISLSPLPAGRVEQHFSFWRLTRIDPRLEIKALEHEIHPVIPTVKDHIPHEGLDINVGLDTTMTVLANGCSRWLAKQLRGFDTAAPKQLYRKCMETAGVVDIQPERIVVHFDKHCHNPILREAALDQPRQVIPWWRNLPVVFQYP